jgi:type IV secretory pathway VirJ component
LAAGVAFACLALTATLHAETLTDARFGEITLYRGEKPQGLVLFLSGDGGWNLGVVSMAEHLADMHTVVAGIDIRHYLAALESADQACVSPAEDLKALGARLIADLKLDAKDSPTLVGYSSGATLVYAALVEAPPGTFKGALSLGFCPDLDLKKPVCRGEGIGSTPRYDAKGVKKGVNFLPAQKLPASWIALQGALDQVCIAADTEKFTAAVPGSEYVLLPKVGHGYGVEHNWLPQYQAAFKKITAGGVR